MNRNTEYFSVIASGCGLICIKIGDKNAQDSDQILNWLQNTIIRLCSVHHMQDFKMDNNAKLPQKNQKLKTIETLGQFIYILLVLWIKLLGLIFNMKSHSILNVLHIINMLWFAWKHTIMSVKNIVLMPFYAANVKKRFLFV